MVTVSKPKEQKEQDENMEYGVFFGELVAFNTSLKLHHWKVSGPCSYAQHVAIDQALEKLTEATDRLVETTYAMRGDIEIVVPQSTAPRIIETHCEKFFKYVNSKRELFCESFALAILDDYQEAIQSLLYPLKRLQ